VQHTAQEIADIVGYADGTWSFRAAGINHQAWILEYRHDGVDALPEVRRALTAYGRGEAEPARPIDEWYAGGREAVRLAVMELTGYFQTESSHHASEYYPHFRRTPEDVARVIPEPWRYLDVSSAITDEDLERLAADSASGELETTEEYAARIVDSIVTNTPRTVYGNVPNRGLITNLPPGACVEVPVLVDGSGVQPTVVGNLPVSCAAVNQASVGLQALTVEAYRTRSRDLVHAAIAMDRLTGAVLPLDRIRAMTEELLEAEREWLPELR
jgi:alpha-galactosidase